MPNSQAFCTIEEALADLQAGRMVVLVDDEHRENEGDLVIAAQNATPEAINFMMRNGCGIVCLAMASAMCERLHLTPVHGGNVDPQKTPFTQSIDARTGITTGTSAYDRARTVAVAIDDKSGPNDFMIGYGHVNGLRAREGGVLVRPGAASRLQGSRRYL
jgi:3,4-dihydroxy 2-butanone 4-phosphate synthase / GTP cyclohydrolase II